MTFEADTDLVNVVCPGRGYERNKFAPRTEKPCAIVIHTTGGGIVKRANREQRGTFETALRVYSKLMDASGHYVIGQAGEIGQCVPESFCAWHVGGKGANRWIDHGARWIPKWRTKRFQWWADRWPDLDSPADLGGGGLWNPYRIKPVVKERITMPRSWARGSCNANTIGIEVAPHPYSAWAGWSDQCWQSIALLVRDIADRYDIPLQRDRIICHSDANPWTRTTVSGKPWDTGAAQFSWPRMRLALESTPSASPAMFV